MASICSSGSITVQHIVDRRTSSGALDVPLLLSPIQVLDDVGPSLPQASLNCCVTGSNHAYSSPEYHSSPLAPASPGLSRERSSSAPDLGGSAEGEGGATAALHKERGALDPPAVALENVLCSALLLSSLQDPTLHTPRMTIMISREASLIKWVLVAPSMCGTRFGIF
ncbi:hypothetical protein H4582DRAFT_776814 [Lactarius indigo]|nr:hypothetical protein H4582DRAFT_776814 [Lactarius indigo]